MLRFILRMSIFYLFLLEIINGFDTCKCGLSKSHLRLTIYEMFAVTLDTLSITFSQI